MEKKRIIIELKASTNLKKNFAATFKVDDAKMDKKVVPPIIHFNLDDSFAPLAIPKRVIADLKDEELVKNLFDTSITEDFSDDLDSSTYLVRGEVDANKLDECYDEAMKNNSVVQVYSDPTIESCLICPGSPPLGDDNDVENLLGVSTALRKCGMTGKGVKVAVVDTGVNMKYLNSKGKTPNFDAANSWKPSSAVVVPGDAPVDHGTMVAYDICIAAPHCTILDIALLLTRRSGSTIMEGFLSDAILAYRHLLNVIQQTTRPGENPSLVVNNSWGMFHPSWDYPVGHPGNYSDNPNHPFHLMVQRLEKAGADILFAAGNCGKDCPDGRCQGVTTNAIYGANSSPYVTCVAGVDTSKARVGYSTIGPGRLAKKKPDISGYTHFSGSGVYTADGGTSAACPVVAGVVAAIRSKKPLSLADYSTRPSAIRNLICSTAIDLGPMGYDYLHGYGVIDAVKIAKKLCRPDIPTICKKYPWICKRYLCIKYPWLCKSWHSGFDTDVDLSLSTQALEILAVDSDFEQFLYNLDDGVGEILERILTAKIETDQKQDSECTCNK